MPMSTCWWCRKNRPLSPAPREPLTLAIWNYSALTCILIWPYLIFSSIHTLRPASNFILPLLSWSVPFHPSRPCSNIIIYVMPSADLGDEPNLLFSVPTELCPLYHYYMLFGLCVYLRLFSGDCSPLEIRNLSAYIELPWIFLDIV